MVEPQPLCGYPISKSSRPVKIIQKTEIRMIWKTYSRKAEIINPNVLKKTKWRLTGNRRQAEGEVWNSLKLCKSQKQRGKASIVFHVHFWHKKYGTSTRRKI